MKKLAVLASFAVVGIASFFTTTKMAYAYDVLFTDTSGTSNFSAGVSYNIFPYARIAAEEPLGNLTTSGAITKVTIRSWFDASFEGETPYLYVYDDTSTLLCTSDASLNPNENNAAWDFFFPACPFINDTDDIRIVVDGISDAIGWKTNNGTGEALPYIIIYSGESPGTDSIAFETPPVANATNFPFPQWTVNYTAAEPGASIKINVCPYLTSCIRYDTLPVSLPEADDPVTKNVLLSGPLTPGGNFTAIAYLYHGEDTLATSSIDFGISITPAYGTTTSTNQFASSTLNCDQYAWFDDVAFDFVIASTSIPWVASTTGDRAFCETKEFLGEAVTFMFVPGQLNDSVGYVSDSITGYKTVLPFSIYFETMDAIQTGLEGATSGPSTSLGIIIPDMGADPDDYVQIDLITSSSLTDALQQSQYCNLSCATNIKDTLFGWMSTAMWAVAGLAAIAIII